LFCLSGSYSKPIEYSEKLLKENITKLGKYKFNDGLKESVANICKKSTNKVVNADK